MSFGSNLENLRKQKGWSQDKLADKLHISRQAISKWENGTSKPDIDNVKSISNIFSIGIDELLDNELPDRAAKLDVEKEEKKENVIQVIKYMIIAVVLIYLISVIGKFISLLTIVNGIQKYANLDNYHYVITTYIDNVLAERVECWFKDGKAKTVVTNFGDNPQENIIQITCMDYNENYGYIMDGEERKEIDVKEYIKLHPNYNLGSQLYSEFPIELKGENLSYRLVEAINSNIIINEGGSITLKISENFIEIKKDNMMPQLYYTHDKNSDSINIKFYSIELGSVESLKI